MHSLVQPIPRSCPIQRVGSGVGHHFFGYYDKTNWGAGDRLLLGQRVAARDFELASDSAAEVGYFDLAGDGAFHPCGRTTAWN